MAETEWQPSFSGERLRLTLAIGEYDHVRDLCDGLVQASGIAITALHLPTEEIFHRFTRYREWEVSEMSFAKYVALRSQGDVSITAIPVFPSRVFRHSSIYVRADGAVRTPEDLAGKRIGVPEWAQTAAVYTRGLLADRYGIDLRGISWMQAGVNQSGRAEKVRLSLPPGISLTPRPETSLDAMLLAGEVDAILTAHPPASFEAGNPAVIRLFADSASVERAYYQETGIFPIMHVAVIRSQVLARFPWVAMNIFDAFDEAKRRSQARLLEYTASRVPLPWAPALAAEAQKLFGADPWPYGVTANDVTLRAFLRWAQVQGVAECLLEPDAIFAPETLHRVRV